MKDVFQRTLTKSKQQYQAVNAKGEEWKAEDGYEWTTGDTWEITEETLPEEKLHLYQPAKFAVLYVYQLASIFVMDQLERCKCFLTESRDVFSSAFILSNDMGSGKTATMLGLIAYRPVPTSGPFYPINVNYYGNVNAKETGAGLPRGVLLRKPRKVLRPALIFTGYGVLNQWANEIKKFFPTARVFVVDGIAALKRFYALVHTSEINNVDIVLVKNKDVTGSWEWRHDEIEEDIIDKGARKIYNMVAVICRGMCFTRLVVDDFDTIGLPPIAGNINALSTWFISSTQAEISGRTWSNQEHSTVESLVHHNNVIFSQITKNQMLYSLFNVHVASGFIKKYMTVGRPRYYFYKFANAVGKVMDLINCMAGDKVSEIMEALNGDAVGEAARLAGIEACDPNQIFKALLQQNYEKLAEAAEVLKHFEEYFNKLDIDALPPFSENPDQEDTYTRKDVRTRRELEWRYPSIRGLLKEEEEKWIAQRDECSACMDKFKASVASNECAVCNLDLDDPDENYAIMPCCNEVIHADCAVRGCNFQKEHVRDGVVIAGRCPFDKTHRVLWEKMTYIKGGFDLSKIDETKILDKDESADSPAESADNACSVAVKKRDGPRTKYEAIQEIIRGIQPEEQHEITLRVPSVMQGKKPLGEPEYLSKAQYARDQMEAAGLGEEIVEDLMRELFGEWMPRVLIFSNFDESLNKIEEDCKARGVRYARLGGTMHQITDQITAFNTRRIDVLIIKSTTHCSSLNLQAATDLVFAHQIKDSHIMRQVLGRIQRAGRKTDARIHWMLFENEITSLDAYKCEPEDEAEPEEEEKPKKKAVKKVAKKAKKKADSEEDEDDE